VAIPEFFQPCNLAFIIDFKDAHPIKGGLAATGGCPFRHPHYRNAVTAARGGLRDHMEAPPQFHMLLEHLGQHGVAPVRCLTEGAVGFTFSGEAVHKHSDVALIEGAEIGGGDRGLAHGVSPTLYLTPTLQKYNGSVRLLLHELTRLGIKLL
jgi:hypothetical protein